MAVPTPKPAAASGAEGRTVLVVDDDRVTRHLFRIALELEGLAVIVASDGEMALDCARRHGPDVIVLDMVMPGLGGMEACRRLRSEIGWAPWVIMVTGRNDLADRWAALESGVDDYVAKPVRVLELVERVKARLCSSAPSFRFGAGRLLGGPEIFEELRRRIELDEPVSATLVEFRGLGPFTRRYNFERGEQVLNWLVEVLLDLDLGGERSRCVVGRLGTTDFLLVADAGAAEPLITSLQDAFQGGVGRWYGASDAERGWVEMRDPASGIRRSRLLRLVTLQVPIGEGTIQGFPLKNWTSRSSGLSPCLRPVPL